MAQGKTHQEYAPRQDSRKESEAYREFHASTKSAEPESRRSGWASSGDEQFDDPPARIADVGQDCVGYGAKDHEHWWIGQANCLTNDWLRDHTAGNHQYAGDRTDDGQHRIEMKPTLLPPLDDLPIVFKYDPLISWALEQSVQSTHDAKKNSTRHKKSPPLARRANFAF